MGILGLAEHLGMEYGNENCRGHSEHAKEGIFRVLSKKIELVYAFRAEKRPKTTENRQSRGNPAGRFWVFGGQHGKMPPKFNDPYRNSFVGVFVTLSIFFEKKILREVSFRRLLKRAKI